MTIQLPLPQSIQVIVRGWLNCNQILLRSPRDAVLIDSGYGRHAGNTLALLRAALGKRMLKGLINTHCHSDHMGGNAMIAREFRCRITVPEGEARHLQPWNPRALWLKYCDQSAPRFEFTHTLAAGERFSAGGLQWDALAAPGHDDDALMFWNARERVLISGDALWERGMGVVFPEEAGVAAIDKAWSTLDVIEQLEPRIVIPGHGVPFSDVAASLASVREKLAAFRSDPAKNARHVIKVMLVYNLLDRGSLRVDSLPSYLEKIPVYCDLNQKFLNLSFEDLASRTLADLIKAGAVRIDGSLVVPTLPA